jgi:hypothetical protein
MLQILMLIMKASYKTVQKKNIAYSTFQDVSFPQPSQIMDALLWHIAGEMSADSARTRENTH